MKSPIDRGFLAFAMNSSSLAFGQRGRYGGDQFAYACSAPIPTAPLVVPQLARGARNTVQARRVVFVVAMICHRMLDPAIRRHR